MTDPRNMTLRLPPLKLHIGGRWEDPVEGTTLRVMNPATGEQVCDAPAGGAADIDRAVRAARGAFPAWRKTPASERGRLLRRLGDAVAEHAEELALIESINNGKTFKEAMGGDVLSAAATYRFWADCAGKVHGEVLPVDGDFHTYVVREPVGVVGAIVPWNFPSGLAAWKLGPSLAAGCTVVLKPSELTPLSALRLAELAMEVGFPPGVVNVVPGLGDPAGEALARHPDVDKVSFTGSTRTARRLVEASSATNLKRLTLELGGKSPQIVLPDADLDAAASACFWGLFGTKGEVCNAGSRIIAHADVHDALVDRLVEKAERLVVGDPLDPATRMGAQVSPGQLDRILGYVEKGKSEGARLRTGGARDERGSNAKGSFMQPTVFDRVRPSMTIAQEEIFGPVLSCLECKDEREALELANGTPYGLAASIWTRDVARAHALARQVKAGVVWINCFGEFDDAAPFGGVGRSGWGRDLSHHALEGFTELKTIWTRLPEVAIHGRR